MKDSWNQRYSGAEYFYGITPNVFLKSQSIHIPKSGKVLCLSEGEGRNAVYLASLGAEVTAVDYSEKAREKALDLAAREQVTLNYIVSPLEDFDFGENRWDAVVAIFAHLSTSVRKVIYEKVVRSLRIGGVFIIESYTPQQLGFATGGPKDPDMLSTVESLRSELPNLTWPILEEAICDLSEGAGHQGKSAVVHGYGIRKL